MIIKQSQFEKISYFSAWKNNSLMGEIIYYDKIISDYDCKTSYIYDMIANHANYFFFKIKDCASQHFGAFNLPHKLLEKNKKIGICPMCQSRIITDDGIEYHCTQCPWNSIDEPNWPRETLFPMQSYSSIQYFDTPYSRDFGGQVPWIYVPATDSLYIGNPDSSHEDIYYELGGWKATGPHYQGVDNPMMNEVTLYSPQLGADPNFPLEGIMALREAFPNKQIWEDNIQTGRLRLGNIAAVYHLETESFLNDEYNDRDVLPWIYIPGTQDLYIGQNGGQHFQIESLINRWNEPKYMGTIHPDKIIVENVIGASDTFPSDGIHVLLLQFPGKPIVNAIDMYNITRIADITQHEISDEIDWKLGFYTGLLNNAPDINSSVIKFIKEEKDNYFDSGMWKLGYQKGNTFKEYKYSTDILTLMQTVISDHYY